MGKRGQLTVFLLIGIFILASTAVFLYLRKDRTSLGIAETVPPEFQPIKIYVEECLQQTTQAAVLLLGTQGGYTTLPPRIAQNPDSTIAFSPTNPVRVPYWQYRGESRVPSIANMEQSIGDYVLGNIAQCLQGFAAFRDKFTITEAGNAEAKVTIGEQEVVVTLRMPIDTVVKGGSDRARMATFNAQAAVQLRKIHALAVEILNTAAQQQFFEDLTLELMTAGPNIPFSDLTLSCTKPRWRKSELAKQVKDLLYYNLPRVRFFQTQYPPFLRPLAEYEQFRRLTPTDVRNGNYPKQAPDDLYEYYHFTFPSAGKQYDDLTAGVFFQRDWQFSFDAKPSRGDTLDASGGKGEEQFLKFLCVHAYRFSYDVEFPVQIVIRDPLAFSGGYAFRYAIPVRIRSNAPDHGGSGVQFFDLPERNEDYCAEQRPEEIMLYAKDKRTLADLTANITFRCLDQFSCAVGSTAFDGAANRLRTHLPAFCKPGSLIAIHPAYLTTEVALTGDAHVDILMPPLFEKEFRVVKRRLTGTGTQNLQDIEFLEPNEQAAVFLTAQSNAEYSAQRRYPSPASDPTSLNRMPLIGEDTMYDVQVILFDQDNNPIGGWVGNWTLTGDTAASGSELIFTAVEIIPHPQSEADQLDMLSSIADDALRAETQPVLR